jgi:predicted GIY-YIG superfamily endonuclease
MYYIYFLRSLKDKGFYIGKTNDLRRRLGEHTSGQVSSTKSRRPLILLGYDTFPTEREALDAELSWKKGYMRERLKIRFGNK